jgi:hypothetical protein
MTVYLRSLRIAARAELISLIILLANLAAAHLKPISSLIGPTHGCAYLFVVAATWRVKSATTTTKAIAAIPGIGGLLALHRLSPHGAIDQPTKDSVQSSTPAPSAPGPRG